jgi:hypothetical protein
MNQLEARRRLYADPRHLNAELEALLKNDHQLAALRERLLALDNKIADILGETAPPKGLAERVILRARYRRGPLWIAGLAASLALVATLLWMQTPIETRPGPIVEAMVDHVIDEPDELADAGNISAENVTASLARIGVTFRDAGYRVRHLAECVVSGRVGRHLVMSTPQGLASFIILPLQAGEMARRSTIDKGSFHAVAIPQRGTAIGAIASQGVQAKQLAALAEQMFVVQS